MISDRFPFNSSHNSLRVSGLFPKVHLVRLLAESSIRWILPEVIKVLKTGLCWAACSVGILFNYSPEIIHFVLSALSLILYGSKVAHIVGSLSSSWTAALSLNSNCCVRDSLVHKLSKSGLRIDDQFRLGTSGLHVHDCSDSS